jgi:hypothetical protein
MQSLVYDFVAIVNRLKGFMPENETKVSGAAFHCENVAYGELEARLINLRATYEQESRRVASCCLPYAPMSCKPGHGDIASCSRPILRSRLARFVSGNSGQNQAVRLGYAISSDLSGFVHLACRQTRKAKEYLLPLKPYQDQMVRRGHKAPVPLCPPSWAASEGTERLSRCVRHY